MQRCIIIVRFYDAGGYGSFCHTLRFRRFHVAHPHGDAQLHGVHESAPFRYISVVKVFQLAESFGRKVFIFFQHFVRFFEFFQHLRVHLFLRIVGYRKVFT